MPTTLHDAIAELRAASGEKGTPGINTGDREAFQRERAAAEAEARDAERQAMHATRAEKAVADIGIPARYVTATLETFEAPASAPVLARKLKLARRYVDRWPTRQDVALGFPHVVCMRGEPGTGKTHLCYAIAREVAARYLAVVVVATLGDVVRDLRAAWRRNEGGPSEAARLARYRGADLLVIDEVSRHAFYGEPTQHLYDLVAPREAALRPTILTSNETPAGLAELLGPALASRAAQWGGTWDFGATDYRAAHANGRLAEGMSV